MTSQNKNTKYLTGFTNVISHEITAPVRVITELSDLLGISLGDDLSEEQNLYIKRIAEAKNKYSEMMSVLNEYSNLIVNHLKDPEAFKILDVIDSVIIQFDRPIAENNAKIILENGDFPEISGDSAQMHQFFWELIDNAIKFRKLDEELLISIAYEKKNDTHLFSIQDNGLGIRPQNQDSVFLLFGKFHPDESYSGHGGGLAMAEIIAELHDGELKVESDEGVGSKFIFSLPV